MAEIPREAAQAFLREVMSRWGRPRRIQVDHGEPWGKGRDLPSALVLWLVGLGVEVSWIPPAKPQYNGVVERAQGVLQQWAEPKRWESLEEGERRLAWAVHIQREGYRGADGKTRLERFPELEANPRRYSRQWEEQQWSLAKVDQYLAQGRWVRRVNKMGQIYVYNWAYSIGRAYAGQEVFICWDPEQREWRVSNREGEEIRRVTPKQFDAQAIRSLQITYVKPSRRKGDK